MNTEVLSISIAFLAVVVSFVGVIFSTVNARRQEVGVNQWRHDLRDWASEAIEILGQAAHACEELPNTSPSDLWRYVFQLRTLTDQGRFYLPNQRPEARSDPVPAFRGYRHGALDPLVAARHVLEGRIDDADLRNKAIHHRRSVLQELQREFVSNIWLILDPRRYNREIARLIRDYDHLQPKDTPLGADELLKRVVPRVILWEAGDGDSRYRF